MRCSNCDYKLDSNSKFCTKCGTSVSQPEKEESGEGSVDKYFNEQKKSLIEEAKALADSEMKQGIIWFVIASAITFGGYLFASEGGTYYVFWGAMIYGIYRLIRGFYYKLNPESLLQKAEEEAKEEK